MLEILLLAIAGFTLLAKKTQKRRFTLRGVRASPSLALSTLLAVTAITGPMFGNADGAYRVMSYKGTWTLEGFTAGEGPIVFGFAHGDYTVTEIKEAIESGASISIGNKVAGEQANRLVRRVGTFSGQVANETLNDGMPIKTRLNWAIPIGTNLNIFAYNDGAATLTTGALLRSNGVAWVKDY